MNALDIKENRKKLGLTQAELAERVGVSLKTISNYENGEVIPESKKALLLKILSSNKVDKTEESSEAHTKLSGYSNKIAEKEEEINARLETIKLLKEKNKDTSHQLKIIEILRTQIEIIKEAEHNHSKDL